MAGRELSVDLRKAFSELVTIRVQMKNSFWVKFGLQIIKLGAWISGANFVDEFPMSLIQRVRCDCGAEKVEGLGVPHLRDCPAFRK